MTHLKEGDTAPQINSVDQNGEKNETKQVKTETIAAFFAPFQ